MLRHPTFQQSQTPHALPQMQLQGRLTALKRAHALPGPCLLLLQVQLQAGVLHAGVHPGLHAWLLPQQLHCHCPRHLHADIVRHQ